MSSRKLDRCLLQTFNFARSALNFDEIFRAASLEVCKMFQPTDTGPVRVPLNPAWSAYFFIWNSVFLSQIPLAFFQTIQIPPEFLQANRPIS